MTDKSIERMVSVLLLTGVLISGCVVLAGGVYYLLRHGGELSDFHTFRGQPSIDRIVSEIIKGAFAVRARSIIQLGILLLIATPIARVAFSLVGFALGRDRTYVVITAIVLTVLLVSLITGAVQG
ncbi:MAG: DUF1634 domain-containing protein [Acidobacteriaceae bacterium]|nr:DUF1634 domain-containing protein [Acidobacteriaceae bacterium]